MLMRSLFKTLVVNRTNTYTIQQACSRHQCTTHTYNSLLSCGERTVNVIADTWAWHSSAMPHHSPVPAYGCSMSQFDCNAIVMCAIIIHTMYIRIKKYQLVAVPG